MIPYGHKATERIEIVHSPPPSGIPLQCNRMDYMIQETLLDAVEAIASRTNYLLQQQDPYVLNMNSNEFLLYVFKFS